MVSEEPFRFAITRMNEMDKIAFSGAAEQSQFAMARRRNPPSPRPNRSPPVSVSRVTLARQFHSFEVFLSGARTAQAFAIFSNLVKNCAE